MSVVTAAFLVLGLISIIAGVRGGRRALVAIRSQSYEGSRWDRASPHSTLGAYIIWIVAGVLLVLSPFLSLGR